MCMLRWRNNQRRKMWKCHFGDKFTSKKVVRWLGVITPLCFEKKTLLRTNKKHYLGHVWETSKVVWTALQMMKCLHCHPNSSKAWYRVHTTFDGPTKIYRHLSGITLQWHSCEYTPRFCYFLDLKGANGGSWGGWHVSNVIPTLLFKALI